ncbi:MAG: aspartate aminotransferase family protein [Holdemanella sp.]|nr:aspartate aminotransferase family protein [Holdemanella sp.]
MDFETVKQKESAYVMNTYGRAPICFVKGEGCTLYDSTGKSYIDLTSGIGVNALGHNHPELVEAISNQAATLMHVSNLYYTEPMVEVAEKLAKGSGLKKVFFANSGAEANEGLIKCARKYSSDKYGNDRFVILSLKQSFHGRTMNTLKATGQAKFHQWFYPFPEGFDYVIANDFEDFKAHVNEHVCAVMMEMIQGEGGVLPLDKDFVQQVSAYCKERDILVCVDEVQTGIGRTGTLFAYQQFGIEPDIISIAKGLGGGFPIGGFMVGEKCEYTMQPGQHGSTFGATPLGCEAANVVLKTVDTPEFLQAVKEKGDYFMNGIRSFQSENIKDVRGMGLMIGIIVDPEKRADYVNNLRDKGILVLTAGLDAIRLLPPLVISYDEIDASLSIMKEIFE